ncbi:MAG TPA: type II CAAX endopeptidase family protein [Candidatus Acidoferrum sp.]|nr:type II CAAX endopeptidase family protein [Candidatus Acidoferrum sp.]
MNGESQQTTSSRALVWIGLFASLFGMLMIRWIIPRLFPGPQSPQSVLTREVGHYCLAASLLLLVRFGEKRSLRTIGIGTSAWWKSLLWGLATFVICMAAALVLAKLTHYTGGEAGKAFEQLPTWLVTLTVLRAGIVEEICYRGYAMERLKELSGSKMLAFVLPLVIFGVGHWTGGWANIVIALVLGGILAGFYLWRRDLIANILGHFLVDFTANVLPRLLR